MISDLQQRVRKALLKEWDPIGVQQFEEAFDEYDAYVEPLCDLLACTKSREEIFAYLWELETEYMGLPGQRSRTWQFAELLIAIAQQVT